MPCKPHRAKRVFARLALIGWLICVAEQSAKAQPGAVEEISRAQAVNQAVADVCGAELGLERWTLDQLESSREDGYASWLDVARQQLLVDVLSQQHKASQDFGIFLQTLLQRASSASNADETDQHSQLTRSLPPITVSLPGSVRLVGWLEPSSISSNLDLQGPMAQRPAVLNEGDPQKELALAEEALAAAENRYRVYSQLAEASEDASRIKHAALQLALARAELKLLHAKQGNLRLGKRMRASRDESLFALTTANELDVQGSTVGEIAHCVTSGSDSDLRDATLRVAAAEACAVGELQAAQITLQRQSLRLAAFQQVYSEGHAGRRELDAAQDQVKDAELLVKQLQSRQAGLKQSYAELRASLAASSPENEFEPRQKTSLGNDATSVDDTMEMPNVRSWPSLLLADPFVVRHVVDLRRHYYETVGQRDALLLKLALLKKRYTKLEAITNIPPSAKSRPKAESGSEDELRATFAAGRQRELRFLAIDIRYHEARAQAANERLNILALEEARLLPQFMQQHFVCSPTCDAASDCDASQVQTAALKTSRGRFSYLESYDSKILGRVCQLAFSKADIDIVRFAYQPRGVSSSPPVQIDIDGWQSRFRPLDCYGGAGSIFGKVNACLRFGYGYSARWDSYPFRTLRYDACDRCGIRRVDFGTRCSPSSRQIPSYLRGLRPDCS